MKSSRVPIIVLIMVTLLVCCLCLLLGAGGALIISARNPVWSWFGAQDLPAYITHTPQVARPGNGAAPPPASTPSPIPTLPLAGSPSTPVPAGFETLNSLEEAAVPTSDLRDLARRLRGIPDIPLTVEPPVTPYRVGDQKAFWASNVNSNHNFTVTATLRYRTDHLYFWIENGVSYSERDLQRLAETFETQIYPTNREFFGSEWTPGVDGDPRLYVLYARNLGNSVAGYYSSVDQVHPLAHEYSNAHEMFFLNADTISLGSNFTYGVLAHEFQHMIHWYQDRNEETWLNEGFSELAAFINGFDGGNSDWSYAQNPDIQLNYWPDNGDTLPHYGASFLFVTYFLDRFGEDATKELVAHPENGLHSVDLVLAEFGASDSLSGEAIDADDLFFDWVLANYLKDASVSDGRFTYHIYPGAPQTRPTEHIRRCPTGPLSFDVHQYGVDYYQITCTGDYILRFEGQTQVGVLPADPYSGDFMFWSNRGDESNMSLTQEFDFTGQDGPLTLSYWTWYDLEKDYDYVYLVASTGDDRWEILRAPSSTSENPSGNSYGWAYNGASGFGPRWIREEVDLTQFAGQKVTLRFEYVTDAAVNGEGFLLDDIAIPEIGYFSDFEADEGGWDAAGFVRIQNILPQTYRLGLIFRGDQTTVQYIDLHPSNLAEIPISFDRMVRDVTLVVSGTTRHTRQQAPYTINLLPVASP
jgi:immune inhibitor A